MSPFTSQTDAPVDLGAPVPTGEDMFQGENRITVALSETGSQASDSSIYSTYFHASCPGCHHWYNKIPIRLFRKSTKHKRFQCGVCKRLLFGIGGNSTQTTLLSQETISRRESLASATGVSSDFQGCTNTRPLELSRAEIGNLGTITEANSPSHVSRQASQRSVGPRASSHHSERPPEAPLLSEPTAHDEAQTISNAMGQGPPELANSHAEVAPKIVPRSGRFRRIRSHAERLFGKLLKIHVRARTNGVHALFTSEYYRNRTPEMAAADSTQEASLTARHTTVDAVVPAHMSSRSASGEQLHEQISSTESHEPRLNSGHGTAPADHVGISREEMIAAKAKLDRILSTRKEKTLQARALQKPRCECTEGCQCMRGEIENRSSGEGHSRPIEPADIGSHLFPAGVEPPEETTDSSTTESRRRWSEVSSEGRQRSPRQWDLTGIGYHLDEQRRSLSYETSSTRFGTGGRPLSRFSQAATAVSNDSSISLDSSAANVPRLSAAGSRPQSSQLQVDPQLEAGEDAERGGPTPTQRSTTTQWRFPSAEGEIAANPTST
ncbi:hypothetical protein MMC16_001055 [Acarospora aff. strigata]|nr:hypothetical protein [Acarospora aff. strigata]